MSDVSFSRGHSSDARAEVRDTEFRGNVPRRLLELIDACAQVEGMGRMEWAISVLEPEVQRRLHKAMVLCRIANVNPLGSEGSASGRAPNGRDGGAAHNRQDAE